MWGGGRWALQPEPHTHKCLLPRTRSIKQTNNHARPDHHIPYVSHTQKEASIPRPNNTHAIHHHHHHHHHYQVGMSYDKLPGEWYGPTTAAYVLRDLATVSLCVGVCVGVCL